MAAPGIDCRNDLGGAHMAENGGHLADSACRASVVFCLAFDNSEPKAPKLLMAGLSTGEIAWYAVRAGTAFAEQRPIFKWQGHEGPVYGAAFVGTGAERLFVTAGDDGRLVLYRWADVVASIEARASPKPCFECVVAPQAVGKHGALASIPEINAIASAGPGRLYAAAGDGVCYVLDTAAPGGPKLVSQLRGHMDMLLCVAARPFCGGNGAELATGSEDGTVKLFDVRQAAAVSTIDPWLAKSVNFAGGRFGRPWWVGALAFDHGGHWLAMGSGGGAVSLWSMEAASVAARFTLPASPQCLTYCASELVVAGEEPNIRTFTAAGAPIATRTTGASSVFSLAADPTGMTAAGGAGPTGAIIDLVSDWGSRISSYEVI